jgi:hypothetical protein
VIKSSRSSGERSRGPDRARIISELVVRNPGIGGLLVELEADDDLRARFEMELLNRRL